MHKRQNNNAHTVESIIIHTRRLIESIVLLASSTTIDGTIDVFQCAHLHRSGSYVPRRTFRVLVSHCGIERRTSQEDTIHYHDIKIGMSFSTTVHVIGMSTMTEHNIFITKCMLDGGVNPGDGSLTKVFLLNWQRSWCWWWRWCHWHSPKSI